MLEGGTVIQYGARTLNEGGFQVTRVHFYIFSILSTACGLKCEI